MMSSPDLLTGLTRLIRYLCLVSDAVNISLEPGVGGRWVQLEIFSGECPIPRQRYDYAIITLLTVCRWMLGRPLKPLSACFCYPVPRSIASDNEAFISPLQFDTKFSGFLISDEDLACKLPTAFPELSDLHERIAGQALRALIKADTSHRARQAIARYLQDGSPLRSTIASELNLSDHTFQRRLTAEGTSFTDLVDDTRKELAQHYLADLRITLAEIAYLLGYADQSTFFRASQRWFGESPGDYRTRVVDAHEKEITAARRK
jgi:AraC-like DNA-binding protein